jgi:hypothetical protein
MECQKRKMQEKMQKESKTQIVPRTLLILALRQVITAKIACAVTSALRLRYHCRQPSLDSVMSETSPKTLQLPLLLTYLIGFALALACALWAGNKFRQTDASIVFGVLTGLSFGAMFAFGQRIKQSLFPASESGKWKNRAPATPELRPAQRAAMRARPLTVQFDDNGIQTLRGGGIQESLAWQELDHIVITIGNPLLPMPFWLLATAHGGIRLANDTAGLEALTEQFKTRLPGYDNDRTYAAIINAMGALEGSFDIWRKSDAPLATANSAD